MLTTTSYADQDGLAAAQLHARRPEGDEPLLAARDERSIGRRIDDAQHRVSVERRTGLRRQLETDLARPHIRVFHLAVLQLHVRAELVPRDGALRRTVDLLEQSLDLTLLKHTNTRNIPQSLIPFTKQYFSLSNHAPDDNYYGKNKFKTPIESVTYSIFRLVVICVFILIYMHKDRKCNCSYNIFIHRFSSAFKIACAG